MEGFPLFPIANKKNHLPAGQEQPDPAPKGPNNPKKKKGKAEIEREKQTEKTKKIEDSLKDALEEEEGEEERREYRLEALEDRSEHYVLEYYAAYPPRGTIDAGEQKKAREFLVASIAGNEDIPAIEPKQDVMMTVCQLSAEKESIQLEASIKELRRCLKRGSTSPDTIRKLPRLCAFIREQRPDFPDAEVVSLVKTYLLDFLNSQFWAESIADLAQDPLFTFSLKEKDVVEKGPQMMLQLFRDHAIYVPWEKIPECKQLLHIQNSRELAEGIEASVSLCLLNSQCKGMMEAAAAFGIPQERLQQVVFKSLTELLPKGAVKSLPLAEQYFGCPSSLQAYEQYMPDCLKNFVHAMKWQTVEQYRDFFKRHSLWNKKLGLNSEDYKTFIEAPGAIPYIVYAFLHPLKSRGSTSDSDAMVADVIAQSGAPNDIVFYREYLPKEVRDFIDVWDLKTVADFNIFISQNFEFFAAVCNKRGRVFLEKDDLPALHFFELTNEEGNNLKYKKVDIRSLQASPAAQDYKRFLQALRKESEYFTFDIKTLKKLHSQGDFPSDIGFTMAFLHGGEKDVALYSGARTFSDFLKLQEFIKVHGDQIESIQEEKKSLYIQIAMRIERCPSQDLQLIKDHIIKLLLETDDPVEAYQSIEDIFVKNNLPLVGKIFRVFQIVHTPVVMESNIKAGSSPYLQQANTQDRYRTIFHDLLRIQVDSGNRSLREFLEMLQQGEELVPRLDETQSLHEDQCRLLGVYMRKMQRAYHSSQLAKNSKETLVTIPDVPTEAELKACHEQLHRLLQPKEGQMLSDRITEMFIAPLGYRTIAEVMEAMTSSKHAAHERGLALARQAATNSGMLILGEGDLLKASKSEFLTETLQGITSNEYFGESESDLTPYDTDFSRVLNEDAQEDFESIIKLSHAKIDGYGDCIFVVKDRGQFQNTNGATPGHYFQRKKWELFRTLDDRHYGIRTGLPATELDFIIVKDSMKEHQKKLEDLYMEVARNGFYIPVTDQKGTLLFPPTMYEDYRQSFQGLDRFDNSEYPLSSEATPSFTAQVDALVQSVRENRERNVHIRKEVERIVGDVLAEYDVKIAPAFDPNVEAARFEDIGSTGRGTNMADAADYDFTLKLNAATQDSPFAHAAEIGAKISVRLQGTQDNSHGIFESGGYQLRVVGAATLENVDIDIGISPSSDRQYFESHDAAKERLEAIRTQHGEDAYEHVLANIVLAKKFLKEHEAYKKVEHGGMGGVSVENWILLNGGNFLTACHTFLEAAGDGSGGFVTLETFRDRYGIHDPGMNIYSKRSDNLIHNLKESGYNRMCICLTEYIASVQDVSAN